MVEEAMDKHLFLCYPKCGTCRKAQQWLDGQGIDYVTRRIDLERPTAEELTLWIERSGLPIRKFFNTSGLKYKALNLKEALKTASNQEMIELLASDGMLVKRPIVVTDHTVLVSFREEAWNHELTGK